MTEDILIFWVFYVLNTPQRLEDTKVKKINKEFSGLAR